MDLLNETRALVKSSAISKKEICIAAKVSPRWLDYLITDLKRDPRISAVQRVYNLLSEKVSNYSDFDNKKPNYKEGE